jgi:putative glycosyltransferase (TIGR04372 family)
MLAYAKVIDRFGFMSTTSFIRGQIGQIRQGGRSALFRKMKRVLWILPKVPLFVLAIPIVVVIRLIRPWLLVRWGNLHTSRIGHFAANTELYLCERDAGINVPRSRYVDFFFTGELICNQQLAKMWKRVLRVWPAWIQSPIDLANRLIPSGEIHKIGNNTQSDRDVHNLLDRFPPHLNFTAEEESRGAAGLGMLGIPADAPFVCLIVRDSAYLDAHSPRDWSYHHYRDIDIQNYVLAVEELADRGYFVVRMGAKVRDSIKSDHPRVIDYATNGMRSDFMDIYLGAKCSFCVSGSSGFNAVPLIFRRPIVFGNEAPFGYLMTYRAQFISIPRHYFSLQKNRELTLREIFTTGAGFYLRTSDYASEGIQLIENTCEEIRDAAVEMVERLTGTWKPQEDDEALQRKFWEIFPTNAKASDNVLSDENSANGKPLYGEIRSRLGAGFLRNNRDWLQ